MQRTERSFEENGCPTLTVRQELKSSGNMIFLLTVDFCKNESLEFSYYARLFKSPEL